MIQKSPARGNLFNRDRSKSRRSDDSLATPDGTSVGNSDNKRRSFLVSKDRLAKTIHWSSQKAAQAVRNKSIKNTQDSNANPH